MGHLPNGPLTPQLLSITQASSIRTSPYREWLRLLYRFQGMSTFHCNTRRGFSPPHQYRLIQSGRIHSSPECFFPDWNESFQSKLSDHGKSWEIQ